MAIRNRKLFPSLMSTNETIYCPDLCDPTCPYYDCRNPEYYFPLPPPPPPPPSSPGAAPISPSLITAVSLLSALFILLGYYVIIRKSCFLRRSRTNHQPPPSDVGDEEFLDENRVDHPIWFITTVGLQQSIINAITVWKYRKGEGLIEGSECSVCLNDFHEGETLRLLPKCSHAFHIQCIDTWLQSHTNCPLCRANIVAPSSAGQSTTRAQLERMEPHGEDLDVIRDNQMENLRGNSGTVENLERDGVLGIGGETGELQGVTIGEVVPKDHHTHDELEMPEEIELERISVSHSTDDSSSSSSSSEQQVHVEIRNSSAPTADLKLDGEANSTHILKMVSAADSSSTEKSMARSHSCGSGYFLSRHSRNWSSILPF
ncbi:RING-H2 finger protein ATL54 [Punica granatum]|uniref:RING-type E3 ubiquitin transferase n=2 Tax=Punica granatum TaxID=22663 RepID=A0A218X851_PUNGR|nr:RING-H2 finger protein ATL54 [Punica granatum]OWM80978.1 hypothetical protein CDL15_Pgr007009 [Punica granatum]PKI45585.1 hypothetical protein CRG98_033901 [Punica granatum]